MYVIKSKNEQRAMHWNEIRQRVTAHTGEILSGSKGREYQEKYGKKYLGKDLASKKQYTGDDIREHERNKMIADERRRKEEKDYKKYGIKGKNDSNYSTNTRFPVYTGPASD